MDPLLAPLQRALAHRYTVEHELGRGGMAVVYLGQDLRHDRRVAIKVFERDGGLIRAAERFLAEIRIAAKLQHPNIVPVFDSGEAEGLVFYVMPYIAGGSVRERLEREGPLPIPDATRIAREVAEALDHAHRAGIVHRDIKPDNIMLADGVAVVADFGIARALDAGGAKITDTGLAIGTPPYMSPEQTLASPQVDGRTDIYALGCVLYEMLAGAPPFSGPNAQAIMARHATDAVPPLATVRKLTPRLEATVTKALAKLPGDRWPTGRAFAAELTATTESSALPEPTARRPRWQRAAAATLVVGALMTGGILVARRLSGANPRDESIHTIAVLPFSVTGDTTFASLADGLTDGVSTGLLRVPGLGIVTGSRVENYRGRAADPREAGRELKVNTVLSAGVSIASNKFRVTARLTDVPSGRLVWQQQFSGELLVNGRTGDVFAIEDSMTSIIVDTLRVRLVGDRQAAVARGVRTRDPEAYRLYVEALRPGRSYTAAGALRSDSLLRRALARDSMFADAWVELASNRFAAAETGGNERPTDIAVGWRRAVERAIALDSLNGNAFALRSFLRAFYDWDFQGARNDMRVAVRLAPGSARIASLNAQQLIYEGKPDSGLKFARRAVELDPGWVGWTGLLAIMYTWVNQNDSALAVSGRALKTDSLWPPAHWARVLAFDAMGKPAEADSAAAWFARTSPSPLVEAFLADHYRRTSNITAARELLGRMRALAKTQYVSPSRIGALLLAIGDKQGALDALEAAVRDQDFNVAFDLPLLYYSLAGDPRFEEVRQRVWSGLPLPRTVHPR